MGLEHVGRGVKTFVGRDQRQVQAVGQVEERPFGLFLHRHAVAQDFHVGPSVIRICKARQQVARGVALALLQQSPDRPAGPAGQQDQAAVVLQQSVQRDRRLLAVVAVQIGDLQHLQQIAVAFRVLDQQHHRGFALAPPAAVRRRHGMAAGLLGLHLHGDLAADDRLDALVRGRQGEFQGPEQVVGVGHGDRRHVHGPAHLGQVLQADGAFGQGIGGMDPQVDEISMGHAAIIPHFGGRAETVCAQLSTVGKIAVDNPGDSGPKPVLRHC